MNGLITLVISELKKIDIYETAKFKDESAFEKYVYDKLDKIINKKIKLFTQEKSYREGREIRPDIIIGSNDILIELKYNLKGIEEIYRLYYQAIKYSKLAKQLLILCVHDPKKILLKSDILDLESVNKVKVVHIF